MSDANALVHHKYRRKNQQEEETEAEENVSLSSLSSLTVRLPPPPSLSSPSPSPSSPFLSLSPLSLKSPYSTLNKKKKKSPSSSNIQQQQQQQQQQERIIDGQSQFHHFISSLKDFHHRCQYRSRVFIMVGQDADSICTLYILTILLEHLEISYQLMRVSSIQQSLIQLKKQFSPSPSPLKNEHYNKNEQFLFLINCYHPDIISTLEQLPLLSKVYVLDPNRPISLPKNNYQSRKSDHMKTKMTVNDTSAAAATADPNVYSAVSFYLLYDKQMDDCAMEYSSVASSFHFDSGDVQGEKSMNASMLFGLQQEKKKKKKKTSKRKKNNNNKNGTTSANNGENEENDDDYDVEMDTDRTSDVMSHDDLSSVESDTLDDDDDFLVRNESSIRAGGTHNDEDDDDLLLERIYRQYVNVEDGRNGDSDELNNDKHLVPDSENDDNDRWSQCSFATMSNQSHPSRASSGQNSYVPILHVNQECHIASSVVLYFALRNSEVHYLFDELKWRNSLLFAAATGLAEQLHSKKISMDFYNAVMMQLQNDCNRIWRNESEISESAMRRECGDLLYKPQEIHLFMYQHWSLYESLLHSQQINARLSLYDTEYGQRDLEKRKGCIERFLTECGIPLSHAKGPFKDLSTDHKLLLYDGIKKYSEKSGLGHSSQYIVKSFQKYYDDPMVSLNTSDMVYCLHAISERIYDNLSMRTAEEEDVFSTALLLLRGNTKLISKSIAGALTAQRTLLRSSQIIESARLPSFSNQVNIIDLESMNIRASRNPFSPSSMFEIDPQYDGMQSLSDSLILGTSNLCQLAMFISDTQPSFRNLPLVICVPVQDSTFTWIVGTDPRSGRRSFSSFHEIFKRACDLLSLAGTELLDVDFERAVVQIPTEHKTMFLVGVQFSLCSIID